MIEISVYELSPSLPTAVSLKVYFSPEVRVLGGMTRFTRFA